MVGLSKFGTPRVTVATIHAGIAICLVSTGVSAANAQLLGQASAYNLFTLGDASNSNVDILGNTAVGGNANFYNYTLATNSGGGAGNVSAVVGGNYTNTYGSVYGSIDVGGNINVTTPSVYGNLAANGSVTLNSYGSVNGAITYGTTFTNNNSYALGTSVAKGAIVLPVNFGVDQSYLDGLSAQLGGLTTTGYATLDYGKLNLVGSGSQEVIDITAAQLAAATSGIAVTAGASGATVIINVTDQNGAAFTIPNAGFTITGTNSSDVLFNFGDASAFTVGPFGASILAPFAAITGESGDFHGNLIADSFHGNGLEIHNDNLFNGTVNGLSGSGPSPVPEPGIVLTATSMLGLVAFGLVLGRRRKTANASIDSL